jgi:uncharacterized membrane protein YphA (DoxX/SURF4 family)
MARFPAGGYKQAVTITRRLARPLLASIFIAEGWDAIRNPGGSGLPLPDPAEAPAGATPRTDDDTLTLVRLNGIVQIGGGVLLAVGKFPRLASLALIGSIVPTTYAGHRFWEESDEVRRSEQRTQLLKNLGLLGGLIFSAVDTEGAPSLGWRARRRVHQVAGALTDEHGSAHESAARAVETSRRARRRANRATKGAARRANVTASGVARQAGGIATQARKGVVGAAPYVRQANETALEAAEEVLEAAGPLIAAGLERAGGVLEDAFDAAGPYLSAGLERAGDLLARVPDHLSTD